MIRVTVAGKPRPYCGLTPLVTSARSVTVAGMLAAIDLLAAVFDLNGHPHYVHSGWFLISVGNLIVIVLMIVVFVLALVLPFPRGKRQ